MWGAAQAAIVLMYTVRLRGNARYRVSTRLFRSVWMNWTGATVKRMFLPDFPTLFAGHATVTIEAALMYENMSSGRNHLRD